MKTRCRAAARVLSGLLAVSFLAGVAVPSTAFAADAPSRFGVDAPELAPPGALAVGVKTMRLVQTRQPDVLAPQTDGSFALRDRLLQVDVWYPATPTGRRRTRGARGILYEAELPREPPAPPARFGIPGVARRDAPVMPGAFPLVIVSHGYSNATVVMSWLTENLASKGYVVASIRHEDPAITDRTKFAALLLRRPLDIGFVAARLQSDLAAGLHIDPSRTALIGYSMGGYGVLTAAGASLDPQGGPAKVPGGLMLPYLRGGAEESRVHVDHVRAVVALAPAGGALKAWGESGLADLRAPLLLIAGDQDHTVNYATGARAFFDAARNTTRYLLTFKEGGHAIGLDPVPEAMRAKLWDQDWFEDPVWRKDRITAIEAHFITAFLDRYVKSDESKASYLELAPESDAGVWPAATPAPAYDAYSPGSGDVTVWKGFQRNHATGLSWRHADPVNAGRSAADTPDP
ncbi:MAG: hypothetical protein U1F35_14270 [Steroidobacteraceae bacterium]